MLIACTGCLYCLALQAAAERQLKEKGLLPAPAADGKAAADGPSPAANGEAAPAAAGGGAAGPSGAGAEDQVAKKIKATTKEILERVAGPGVCLCVRACVYMQQSRVASWS